MGLHCPLTPETETMINTERLKQLKSTAYLIKDRGSLANEAALPAGLAKGVTVEAGLDGLDQPTVDHPPPVGPNGVITPHIAWATRPRLIAISWDNLRQSLLGHPPIS